MKKTKILKNRKNKNQRKKELNACINWSNYYFGNIKKNILPF